MNITIFTIICLAFSVWAVKTTLKTQPRKRNGQYDYSPKTKKAKRQIPIKEGSTVIGYIYL